MRKNKIIFSRKKNGLPSVLRFGDRKPSQYSIWKNAAEVAMGVFSDVLLKDLVEHKIRCAWGKLR